MKRFVPEWLIRVPQRDLGLAAFWTIIGCIWIVLSVSAFVFSTQGIVPKASFLMLTLTFFMNASFYALPDRQRRTKQWLRVAVLLLGLVLLSAAILMFVAGR